MAKAEMTYIEDIGSSSKIFFSRAKTWHPIRCLVLLGVAATATCPGFFADDEGYTEFVGRALFLSERTVHGEFNKVPCFQRNLI